MLQQDNIRTMLFTILCICFIFYLLIGAYSYKKDNKSKINKRFLVLCSFTSIWAIGYAFMLISPNIEIANIWRIFSGLGWCFFNGAWILFAFSFEDTREEKPSSKIKILLYLASMLFFINNLMYKPSEIVGNEAYGFVDNVFIYRPIDIIYNIYIIISFMAGLIIIYFQAKKSKKNRVKKQIKIIFTTSLVSFSLTLISDFLLPLVHGNAFPFGIIAISIAMAGMWYAINKYKMMSISPEFVSKYIFEAINEPIFIVGEDFIMKNCNEALLNITDYSYKDIYQNSFDTIIDVGDYNFKKIIQKEKITNIEVELLRKNKESLVCELSATVMYDEYKDILGIVILLHDVSERNNIAEMQHKTLIENKSLLRKTIEYDRLKTEFFSNISHEFRTPLNIILSAIQLLNFMHNEPIENSDSFTVAFEKYIDIMRQNAYRLLKLINNIIDLTKIDAGFSEINLNNHNIVAVVEDITLSIVDYVKSKRIELIFDTDFEEKIIACDEEKIERIMLNLLSNAIKYTKSGGTIKVHVKNIDTNVMISVKDTGTGIPIDKLKVIFERFRQVDELLTRRAEGSGIGLSLVKSLVESHGGTISATSVYGSGSEFVILLPSRIVENTEIVDLPIENINDDEQLQKKVERISIEFSDIYKN